MKLRLFLCSMAACITVFLTGFIQVKHQPVLQKTAKEKFNPFSCPGPANLTSYPQLGYSSVKWSVPYTATYEFECYYSGDTPGSREYLVESQTLTTGKLTFNADVPGYYDWQVRVSCPNDEFSSWSYASFYVSPE